MGNQPRSRGALGRGWQGGAMALLRVDARALLPLLRGELTALLASLPASDWERPTACPGWSVHGIAAHLDEQGMNNVRVELLRSQADQVAESAADRERSPVGTGADHGVEGQQLTTVIRRMGGAKRYPSYTPR